MLAAVIEKTENRSLQVEKLVQAIFEVEDLPRMIRKQIEENTLSGRLYWIREDRIREILDIPLESGLHKGEHKHIDQILVSLKELTHYLSLKDLNWDKHFFIIQRLSNQVFAASYRYLCYRIEGIKEHLSIVGIEKFYQKPEDVADIHYYARGEFRIIRETFAEYKVARELEMIAYLKQIEVVQAIWVLQKHAPNLFHEQKSANEMLSGSSNSFCEAGATLGKPLLLKEISAVLLCLGKVLSEKRCDGEVLKVFSDCLPVFVRTRSLNDISELVRCIYGCAETLANWPINLSLSFDTKSNLRMCLSMGLSLSDKIPYSLLSIDAGKVKEAEKILALQDSHGDERNAARRILIYKMVPWQALRNLSLILFKADRNQRPHDEAIVFAAVNDLREDYKNLLPILQYLIQLEVKVAQGEGNSLDLRILLNLPKCPSLEVLGQYGGDIVFLHKISEVLESVDFKKISLGETALRIFEILGECGKNLSSKIRQLMGESLWNIVAKMRDKIAHDSKFVYTIGRLLRSKELVLAINEDFIQLNLRVKNISSQFPNDWMRLKAFYQEPISNLAFPPLQGGGIVRLLQCIESSLTDIDREELRATFADRNTNLETVRDRIVAVMEGIVPAKSIDQKDFFQWVEDLIPIRKSQKQKIKEAYKNLRQGKEVANISKLVKELCSVKMGEDQDTPLKLQQLIEEIGSYSNFESFVVKLNQFGFLPGAVAIWKIKHQKLHEEFKRRAEMKQPVSTIEQEPIRTLEEIVQDAIRAAINILKSLKGLAEITKGYRDTLDVFWENPALCYAVEHYFVRIRVYVEAIQEAVTHLQCFDILDPRVLALNELYRILSLKLKQIRSYGNSLAHLHDVTEFDGSTIHGWRFKTYQILLTVIDGLPYGGRDGKPVKHLPSFYDEIKVFTDLFVKSVTNPTPSAPPKKLDNSLQQYSNFRSSTPLLKGKLPSLETVLEFEEHDVKRNGDCCFTAVGVDRAILSQVLLMQKDVAITREYLREEIESALRNGEFIPPCEEWKDFFEQCQTAQSDLDSQFRSIRDQQTNESVKIKPLEYLITWLQDNKQADNAQALMQRSLAVFQAENALKLFCARVDTFENYVNALKGTLWLGYKSALLYAKHIDMDLYIWRKSASVPGKIELVDYHVGQGHVKVVHMLHTDGFTHFNLLSIKATIVPGNVVHSVYPFY